MRFFFAFLSGATFCNYGNGENAVRICETNGKLRGLQRASEAFGRIHENG